MVCRAGLGRRPARGLERRMREQWGRHLRCTWWRSARTRDSTPGPETLGASAGQPDTVGAYRRRCRSVPHPAFRELPHLEWRDSGDYPVAAAMRRCGDPGADWVALVEPGDRLAPQALAAAIEVGSAVRNGSSA